MVGALGLPRHGEVDAGPRVDHLKHTLVGVSDVGAEAYGKGEEERD